MTKRHVLLTIGAALLSTSAFAADLGGRDRGIGYAPAAMAPQGNGAWTGFYAGVNAGAALSTKSSGSGTGTAVTGFAAPNDVETGALRLRGKDQTGFTGGLTVGYNQQVDQAVFGLEGDLNYLGLRRRNVANYDFGLAGTGTLNSTERADYLATLRVRAGYLVTPQFLLYATGGLAVTDIRTSGSASYNEPLYAAGFQSGTLSGSKSGTRAGYVLGAGMEYEISPALTLKGEYLYANFGNHTLNLAGTNASVSTSRRFDTHVFRLGMNYRFGTF
jgi:outer membrane immunogenic protein